MKIFRYIIFISVAALINAHVEIDLSELNIYEEPNVIPPFQPRIVGGNVALPHQFPHQVALITSNSKFCSGSIIKDNVVLTSARCLDRVYNVTIIGGAHNITNPDETTRQTKLAKLSSFKIHPNYTSTSLMNNIALINLSDRFNINEYVKTVSLYRGQSTLDNTQATVSGWGTTSDASKDLSPVLNYVTNKILPNAECKLYFPLNIDDKIVCLDGRGFKGGCHGDSGAPLHIAENNQLFQTGVVSFGYTLCEKEHPSAFSRISSFLRWIDENMPK